MLARPPLEHDADGFVERTVTTNDGVRLAVRDYGSARSPEHTVVLLHGLLLTQESWKAQVSQLMRWWGDSVRVITYDHRGHGRSAGAPMHTYRIDRLAADLAGVLTTLRVTGPLTLAGHSMGGMTALAYLARPAVDRPVDPQGLVLIATAAGRLSQRGIGRLLATPATTALYEVLNRMPRSLTDQAVRSFIRPLSDALLGYADRRGGELGGVAAIAGEATRTVSLPTAVGFLEGLKHYDEYRTLASVSAKTVVVSGGADITTPAAHALDLVDGIPGAAHLHRPAAGHMLLLEAPDYVATAINHAMGMPRGSGRATRALARTKCHATQLAAAAS